MARILIADPDPTFRNALSLWLSHKFQINEIVQVSDGQSLADHLRREASDLDAVLMDWSLPHRPDPDVVREIQKMHPELEWIVLSVDPKVSFQAQESTRWFVQKGSSLDDLTLVLEDVLDAKISD